MKKQRGMGTVYQRGQSWVVDYYISGKRVRGTVEGAETESQARQKHRPLPELGIMNVIKIIAINFSGSSSSC